MKESAEKTDTSSPIWCERDTSIAAPPLLDGIAAWEIEKVRESHWNGRRLHAGKRYFVKWFIHGRLANPARREWRNALDLTRLGIPTVRPAGWGRHARGTFVVLEGSPGLPSHVWRKKEEDRGQLDRLTGDLARMVARLHGARLCHRDLNVYHVLVHEGKLRIIDVGRVARFRLRRWIVKDLASLLCSARREGFPDRVARLFLREYLKSRRDSRSRRRLIRSVLAKAEKYRRHNEERETPFNRTPETPHRGE